MAAELDPRFDPIFQRGYGGGTDGGAAANTPPPQRTQQERRPADAYRAEAQPAEAHPADAHAAEARFAHRVGSSSPRGPAPPWVEHPEAPEVTTEFIGAGDTTDDVPARMPTFNPFIIVLWIIGTVLVVTGYTSTWGAYTQQFGPNNMTQGDYAEVLAVLFIGQQVLIVGLLIIAGLLFWHASSFRRRARNRGSGASTTAGLR